MKVISQSTKRIGPWAFARTPSKSKTGGHITTERPRVHPRENPPWIRSITHKGATGRPKSRNTEEKESDKKGASGAHIDGKSRKGCRKANTSANLPVERE